MQDNHSSSSQVLQLFSAVLIVLMLTSIAVFSVVAGAYFVKRKLNNTSEPKET